MNELDAGIIIFGTFLILSGCCGAIYCYCRKTNNTKINEPLLYNV